MKELIVYPPKTSNNASKNQKMEERRTHYVKSIPGTNSEDL